MLALHHDALTVQKRRGPVVLGAHFANERATILFYAVTVAKGAVVTGFCCSRRRCCWHLAGHCAGHVTWQTAREIAGKGSSSSGSSSIFLCPHRDNSRRQRRCGRCRRAAVTMIEMQASLILVLLPLSATQMRVAHSRCPSGKKDHRHQENTKSESRRHCFFF